MKQPKRISEIDWLTVLYPYEGRSYSYKRLADFDDDDFASYVLDHEEWRDGNGIGRLVKDNYLYKIEYLQYIPNYFARVYLYGVWSVMCEMKEAVAKNKTNYVGHSSCKQDDV